MNKLSIKITSSFLILMFIVSGLTKIFTLGKSESERLSKKIFNLNKTFSQFIVFGAGLWELIGSVIILSGIWYSNKLFLHYGSLMLIIFTIIATVIFYIKPFKYLPLLSNLTTTCALLLLPFICIK